MFKKDSQIPNLIVKLFRKAIKVLCNYKMSSKEFVQGFKVTKHNKHY